jgi:hypothetical protein
MLHAPERAPTGSRGKSRLQQPFYREYRGWRESATKLPFNQHARHGAIDFSEHAELETLEENYPVAFYFPELPEG